MSKNNVILTGIPRSGTSLVCSLLNQCENVLALVEPIQMGELLGCNGAEERKLYLQGYFESARNLIMTEGKIVGLDFENTTNTFASDSQQLRKNTIKGFKEQYVDRNLQTDFAFVIKHPNAFTALLEELVLDWDCFAVIRNPVAVIASWATLSHPLRDGHAPMAEQFNAQIKARLAQIDDSLTRQLCLINWYFEQYAHYLVPHQIIRYESVIRDAGAALQVISAGGKSIGSPSGSMNKNALYDKQLMAVVAERLIHIGGAWKAFYSEDDLLELVAG